MEHAEPSYGLWTLVVLNVAIFVIFAFSFFRPASARDWRSFGAFTAFIVALFVEMYGFLLQWPTLLTLLMFPVLVVMYARLAHNEERESARRFGQDWEGYAQRVPRFIPRWGARAQP